MLIWTSMVDSYFPPLHVIMPWYEYIKIVLNSITESKASSCILLTAMFYIVLIWPNCNILTSHSNRIYSKIFKAAHMYVYCIVDTSWESIFAKVFKLTQNAKYGESISFYAAEGKPYI